MNYGHDPQLPIGNAVDNPIAGCVHFPQWFLRILVNRVAPPRSFCRTLHALDDFAHDPGSVKARVLRNEPPNGPQRTARFVRPNDPHGAPNSLRMDAWECFRPAFRSASPASI